MSVETVQDVASVDAVASVQDVAPTLQGRISVKRTELAAALARLADTIPSRSPRPVVSTVKISVNGCARLTGNNLERSHHETLDCEHSGEFEVCVNAAEFRKLITTSKAAAVDVELWSDHISVNGCDVKFAAAVEEFPGDTLDIQPDFIRGYWNGAAAEFADIIDVLAPACDVDSSRYSLGGICLEFHGQPRDDSGDVKQSTGLVAIATDGRRLHCSQLGAPDSDFDMAKRVLLPVDAAEVLARALHKGDRFTITADDNCVVATVEKGGRVFFSMATRQIEGRFPNWKQVIPESDRFATVDAAAFAQLTSEAIATIGRDEYESVATEFDIDCGRKSVSVATTTKNAKFKRSIDADCRLSEAVKLNACYVNQFAKAVSKAGDKTVDIRFAGSHSKKDPKPVVLESGRFTAVVMPMG